MASSLFGGQTNTVLGGNNSIFNRINAVKNLIGGNPQGVYENLLQTNPQFAEFVRANQGKTPEQIAQENGIDINAIKTFMK
jgi:hypothetical protein